MEKKIGALVMGKAEFGPRSLGNRSIIAVTDDDQVQKFINSNIKKRPSFQPFCPSILYEEKDRLFETSYFNKHMTCAFKMKEEHIGKIPASVHVDGTARVQFVNEEVNPHFYKLLKLIKKKTGYGVLINTSYNLHGRTIVRTANDALTDFIDCNLDFLVLGNYLVLPQRKVLS
jgi:carbamoyltransferase